MIIYDQGENRQLIYDMWERNFHDPIPYADFYFEEVYPKNQVILLQDEELIKGMIHWNPYTLRANDGDRDAIYIVGVATDEDYRREGVMRQMLIETFEKLREAGQCFTYLMPADPAYYLPFDFRFGMEILEAEIDLLYRKKSAVESAAESAVESVAESVVKSALEFAPDLSWSFKTEITEEEAVKIADLENVERDRLFAVHTKITPEYLNRVSKEAKSDFARQVYVFDRDEYKGRFIQGVEDRYMTISQVMCVWERERDSFLEQAIAYSENRYHYGMYRLTLDESYEGLLEAWQRDKTCRILPIKHKPVIMFRILDLCGMGDLIKGYNTENVPLGDFCDGSPDNSTGDSQRGSRNITQNSLEDISQKITFSITDSWLEAQSGIYRWEMTDAGSVITKVADDEEVTGGTISIADLTDLIFGKRMNLSEDFSEGLSDAGRRFLENLIPIQKNCILEIV